MEQPVQNGYLKQLQILCTALIAGVVFFLIIALVITYTNPNHAVMVGRDAGMTKILLAVFAVLLLISIGGGYYYAANKKLQSIPNETDTNARLNLYRAAFLIKGASVEAPSFFAIICFILTGNYIFAGIAVILILLLVSNYPKRDKIAEICELTEEEKANFL